MDKHLQSLAARHIETKFVRVRALLRLFRFAKRRNACSIQHRLTTVSCTQDQRREEPLLDRPSEDMDAANLGPDKERENRRLCGERNAGAQYLHRYAHCQPDHI